jgi:hypothetical protein
MKHIETIKRVQELKDQTDTVAELLIYMIGDHPAEHQPTEDELLNVLIGFQTLNKYSHIKLIQELKVADKLLQDDTF